MTELKYAVITPVRDEADHISATIESMAAQTLLPQKWVVVDDGSSDGTPDILDAASAKYPWLEVIHRPNRGFRKSGGGVIEAFYDGYRSLNGTKWEFLVKLDGDLSFAADYFEKCFAHFSADSRLGIGGGMVCVPADGSLVEDAPGDPPFHVRGATKVYSRACWEQISPLVRAPGWDTIDEVKANMLGCTTRTFRDLKLIQHKATGAGDGEWRNWFKNGLANYVTGYHPAFMIAKCLKRAAHHPGSLEWLALLTGFCSGYLKKIPRVDDIRLIRYLRQQQVRRLSGRPSIYG
ncbi:MAG: glycosyltransferase [Syntrophobacteraceae bacterium]